MNLRQKEINVVYSSVSLRLIAFLLVEFKVAWASII